jgi:4a-hydroxytetrahydrobiopterin dehydratase
MAKVSSEGAGPRRGNKRPSGPAATSASDGAHTVPQLSERAIDSELAKQPEWARVGDAIQRTFFFKDFVASMAFVDRVAQAAEADAHHPDILIRYNKVTLTLSTHDAGGISHKDFALAAKADALAGGTTG